MTKSSNVVPIKSSPLTIAHEAKRWAARILIQVPKQYGPKQKVMLFRVLITPPSHVVLKKIREILIETAGYENVEWFVHGHFMWDIVIYRDNPPLLALRGRGLHESKS